jgi:DNA-binding NarL/FixJ family response regulator
VLATVTGSVLRTVGTGSRIELLLTDVEYLDVSPTILIVDDHAAFRAVVRAVLEADGYDVIGEAADGSAGLNAARELKPDIVLLDVRLPDMDGFTVAGALTCGGAGPSVVVTSSSEDPLYPERAQSSGALGFIAKHDVCGAALERLLA